MGSVITEADARALAWRLAGEASGDDSRAWDMGVQALEHLDGRSWLALDRAARRFSYVDGAPVIGAGWLSRASSESSGFVAAVASLHVDGTVRERTISILSTAPAAVAVPALSLRVLDHVPQVRARAWEALVPLIRAETAEPGLDVLTAASHRLHAPDALTRYVEVLLLGVSATELVAMLARSERRRVRRWAYVFGHEHHVLTPGQLHTAASADSDQWIRAAAARWLLTDADPRLVAELLEAGSVDARLVALARVPEADLSNEALAARLLDRAPRVRAQARLRAQRRRLDLGEFYRQRLSYEVPATARVAVACLDGLALSGDEGDVVVVERYLTHPQPRVRAAAIGAVEARAGRNEAAQTLAPLMLDPSPRVSTAAARALARLGAPASLAEDAWRSTQPWSRRAAWRLSRAAGGWHRVEADLRAGGDTEPLVSSLGAAGIRSWLDAGAASTWQPLPESQRERIIGLLPGANLDPGRVRVLSFHAGIRGSVEEPSPAPDAEPEPLATVLPMSAALRCWSRLLRRR